MPRPMDLGRAVLFAGSALLLISLFIEWYDVGLTGWEVFETLDLVLAALAVGGLVASVRPDLLPPWSGLGIPLAALVIVAVQLLNDPPAAVGASPASGAWIALAGTFLMAAGSALSLSAISISVEVRERDVRRRIPAVDRRNDDLAAEDLDADAGADVDEAPPSSLFATGLGGAATDADVGTDAEPPRRTGRFTPRSPDTAGDAGSDPDPATAVAGGAPAPGRPEATDLERTQPLAGLPDDADEPERR